jgi:hypothetical protein
MAMKCAIPAHIPAASTADTALWKTPHAERLQVQHPRAAARCPTTKH